MFSTRSQVLPYLLLVWFWIGSASCQPTPTYVYIASERTPQEMKQTRGMYSPGITEATLLGVSPDISLFQHARGERAPAHWDRDGCIGTTTSRAFALHLIREHMQGNGYIYRVHVTPNFIDVDGTLGQYSPFPEYREFAALGRIVFGQIVAWQRIEDNREQREVLNHSYEGDLYDHAVAGGVQPQLAGFPEGHAAWNQDPWRPFGGCGNLQRRSNREQCRPISSARSLAVSYMAKQVRVDCLAAQVNLTGQWAAGTADRILLGFGGTMQLTEIYDDPSSGDSSTVVIKMNQVFNASEVTLFDISRPSIMQLPTAHPFLTDDFQVHSRSQSFEV